jgi:hypothetical protein
MEISSKTDLPVHSQQDDDSYWPLFFSIIFHSASVVSILAAICLIFVDKASAEFVVSVVTLMISSPVAILSRFAIKRKWFR